MEAFPAPTDEFPALAQESPCWSEKIPYPTLHREFADIALETLHELTPPMPKWPETGKIRC